LEVNYHMACVTFIDVLGFRSIVDDVYLNNPGVVKAILDQLALEQGVTDAVSQQSFLAVQKPTVVMSFSDSVVRIADLQLDPSLAQGLRVVDLSDNNDEAVDIVTKEVHSLKRMQMRLAIASIGFEKQGFPGVFIRGGLTIGMIFYDTQKHQVFGPAMNKAVTLENSLAVYPRIVIDPDCVENYPSIFTGMLRSGLIASDSDNSCYIDYLTPGFLLGDNGKRLHRKQLAESELDFSNMDIIVDRHRTIEQLVRMKEVIEQRLKTHTDSISVAEKHEWVREHHNAAVMAAARVLRLSQQEIDSVIIRSLAPSSGK